MPTKNDYYIALTFLLIAYSIWWFIGFMCIPLYIITSAKLYKEHNISWPIVMICLLMFIQYYPHGVI